MTGKKKNPILDKAAKLRDALRKIDEATGNRTLWTVDNQQQVSEFFGVSLNTVMNWSKQGMPGHRGTYRLDLIAHWLRNDGPWQRYDKTNESGDPLLAEGDSPGLERYRMAKAQHAELDLQARKGELIDVDKCRDTISRWAIVIRRMSERLQKRYGAGVSSEIETTLKECDGIMRESLGND